LAEAKEVTRSRQSSTTVNNPFVQQLVVASMNFSTKLSNRPQRQQDLCRRQRHPPH
jgi:hypothetical protein